MQGFIRADFIQKLWLSQYQMEKKKTKPQKPKTKQQASAVELGFGNGASAQGNWRQINFSFLIKTLEYFYVVVFRKQMSKFCH